MMETDLRDEKTERLIRGAQYNDRDRERGREGKSTLDQTT